MTKSVIDELLQAMLHIKHTLIKSFSVMKICLVYSLSYFNTKLQSSGFISGLLEACDIDIYPFKRDTIGGAEIASTGKHKYGKRK